MRTLAAVIAAAAIIALAAQAVTAAEPDVYEISDELCL